MTRVISSCRTILVHPLPSLVMLKHPTKYIPSCDVTTTTTTTTTAIIMSSSSSRPSFFLFYLPAPTKLLHSPHPNKPSGRMVKFHWLLSVYFLLVRLQSNIFSIFLSSSSFSLSSAAFGLSYCPLPFERRRTTYTLLAPVTGAKSVSVTRRRSTGVYSILHISDLIFLPFFMSFRHQHS
jgi:hypothetical protein